MFTTANDMLQPNIKITMNYLAFLMPFLFTANLSAQEPILLKDKYYLDLHNFENGTGILEIREFLNYDFYKKFNEAINNNDKSFLTDENTKTAFAAKKYQPTEGNYFLENEFEKFQFCIDKNGLFVNSAMRETTEKSNVYHTVFYFQNGKVVKAETKDLFDQLRRSFEINDSVFVMKKFDKDEILWSKDVIKNGGGLSNAILTEYYTNGQIKRVQDNINGILKLFYENGKPQFYQKDNNRERIDYDSLGIKTEHLYLTKTEKCTEYFERGIIQSKECENIYHLQSSSYHYVSGKLSYYEITDRTKDEIRKYDKNNKLISKKAAGKEPSISTQ